MQTDFHVGFRGESSHTSETIAVKTAVDKTEFSCFEGQNIIFEPQIQLNNI